MIEQTSATAAAGRAPVGSAVVAQLRKLSPRIRQTLRIPDIGLQLLDSFIILLRIMVDPLDTRPVSERWDDLEEVMPFPASQVEELVEKFRAQLEADPDRLERWLKRWFAETGPRRFLTRVAGAAANRRLQAAFNADRELIFTALRRGVDALLPIAQAIDSCGQFAGNESSKRMLRQFKPDSDAPSLAFVLLGVNLGDVLEKIGALDIEDLLAGGFSDVHFAFTDADVRSTVDRLAEVVSSDSRDRISSLNDRLMRKIQGAGDALDNSVDGASQAANSLVEFIDRLLRAVARDDDVLQWLSTGVTLVEDGTYITPSGKTRPTKRSQAFFFTSGHKAAIEAEADVISGYIVDGLVGARAALEKVKHADRGSDDEKETVRQAARAIEGFVVYALRIGWLGRTDTELDLLRSRIAGV